MIGPTDEQRLAMEDGGLLSRQEANPNGNLAPVSQGQALGINSHTVTPSQPVDDGTGAPIFNSLGQQVGTESSAPLFQAPWEPPTGTSIGKPASLSHELPAPSSGVNATPGLAASPMSEAPAPQTVMAPPTKPTGISSGAGGKSPLSAADTYLGASKEHEKASETNNEQMKQAVMLGADAERAKSNTEVTGMLAANAQQKEQQDADALHWQNAQAEADKADAAAKAKAQAIADKKIDPNAYYKELGVGGSLFTFVGLALGAIGGGNGGGNSAVKVIDNAIDRNISAQVANKQSQEKALDVEMGLNKDKVNRNLQDNIFRNQRRVETYELAKNTVLAQAATYNDPIIQSRADSVVSELQQKQDDAKLGLAKDIYNVNLAKENAAKAAAAAGAHTQADIQKRISETAAKLVENGTYSDPQEAMRVAAYMHTGADAGGKGPLPVGAKKPGSESELEKKQKEAQQELSAGIKNLDHTDVGKITASGRLADYATHSWLPATDNAKKETADRDNYNANVNIYVGTAYRLGSGGMEPKNPNYIEEQAKGFRILPSDSEDVARYKVAALKRHLTDMAAGHGAVDDSTPASPPMDSVDSQLKRLGGTR